MCGGRGADSERIDWGGKLKGLDCYGVMGRIYGRQELMNHKELHIPLLALVTKKRPLTLITWAGMQSY